MPILSVWAFENTFKHSFSVATVLPTIRLTYGSSTLWFHWSAPLCLRNKETGLILRIKLFNSVIWFCFSHCWWLTKISNLYCPFCSLLLWYIRGHMTHDFVICLFLVVNLTTAKPKACDKENKKVWEECVKKGESRYWIDYIKNISSGLWCIRSVIND